MSSSSENNSNDAGTRRSLPSQKKAPSSTNTNDNKNPSRTLTRDEQANLELQEFLAALNSEVDTAAASKPSPNSFTSTTSTSTGRGPSSISPESLYPTEMSCRQAFDQAFYCQSPGGQFTNVYRYGSLRDCSESWRAFWFCMRTKSYPDEERRRRIREFYKQRDRKYYVGPSSEDVWDMRTKPVLEAFNKTPPGEATS